MENNKKSNAKSIIVLVLGIVGMLLSCVFAGIIPCIICFIWSIIGLIKNNIKNGFAIGGLTCSIIGILIFVVCLFSINGSSESTVSETEQKEILLEQEKLENDSKLVTDTEQQKVAPDTQGDAENTETSYEEDPIETENKETKNTEITEIRETEEEYKSSCKEYTYKDVLRNPENYVGQRVKIIAKISSVHEKSILNPTKYYFAYTNDEYDMWFGDEYGIFDCRDDGDFKILEDDVVAIYGEISEPQETTSLITNSQEIFCIDMKYAELISE